MQATTTTADTARAGTTRPSQGRRASHHNNNRRQPQQSINSVDRAFTSKVDKAVCSNLPAIPQVKVTGYWATHGYMSVGQVLVIRHPIDSNPEQQLRKVMHAAHVHDTKKTVELVHTMMTEGMVSIVDICLPLHAGDFSKRFQCDPSLLYAGESYDILTIFRLGAGTWFNIQPARHYVANPARQTLTATLPLIASVIGDRKRADHMLGRLSQFSDMDIHVCDNLQYMQYRLLPLGQFEESMAEVNDERQVARRALQPADVATADELIRHTQNRSGFDHPFGGKLTVEAPEAEVREYTQHTSEQLVEAAHARAVVQRAVEEVAVENNLTRVLDKPEDLEAFRIKNEEEAMRLLDQAETLRKQAPSMLTPAMQAMALAEADRLEEEAEALIPVVEMAAISEVVVKAVVAEVAAVEKVVEVLGRVTEMTDQPRVAVFARPEMDPRPESLFVAKELAQALTPQKTSIPLARATAEPLPKVPVVARRPMPLPPKKQQPRVVVDHSLKPNEVNYPVANAPLDKIRFEPKPVTEKPAPVAAIPRARWWVNLNGKPVLKTSAEVQAIVNDIGTGEIAIFREDDPEGTWSDPEAFGFRSANTIPVVPDNDEAEIVRNAEADLRTRITRAVKPFDEDELAAAHMAELAPAARQVPAPIRASAPVPTITIKPMRAAWMNAR